MPPCYGFRYRGSRRESAVVLFSLAALHALVKITRLLLLLGCLVTACQHTESHPTVSATELRAQIVGSWWYDDYNPDGPFVHVTFSPDGRFSSLNTNSPSAKRHDGYWRVTPDGVLLVTQTKDALPQSNNEMFILDRLTDTEMIFSHLSVAGRMTFKK